MQGQRLAVPPLEEQHRIVAILDEAFEAIATATSNAEKNLANAREIGTAYLKSALASEHGNWKEVPLCALADVGSGVGFPDRFQGIHGEQYPFFKVGDMNSPGNETWLIHERHSVSDQTRAELGARIFPVGSIVFPKVGGAIATDKKRVIGRAGCVDNNIMGVIPKPEQLNSDLLLQLLINKPLSEFANDAGLPSIRKTTVEAWRVRVPEALNDQKRLASQLNAMSIENVTLREVYGRKLAALAELRQSLLARAFSGELTASAPIAAVSSPANDNDFATPEQVANVLAVAFQRHAAAGRQKNFGHVMAQKNLHVVESVGGVELGRQPWKEAAGPNDFKHMLRAEDWARENHFFEFVKRPGGYDFKKLGSYEKLLQAARVAVKPIEAAIRRATDLLVGLDTEDAEVLATVHAAWNNLILDGVTVTDDAIVREARDDWHPDKLKIAESKFRNAIRTIRKKGIVPDGSAKRVAGQPKLL